MTPNERRQMAMARIEAARAAIVNVAAQLTAKGVDTGPLAQPILDLQRALGGTLGTRPPGRHCAGAEELNRASDAGILPQPHEPDGKDHARPGGPREDDRDVR